MLHELLTRHRDDILSRYSERLRRRHPERDPAELIDTLPSFIDELIQAERREAGMDDTAPAPTARGHGSQRFRTGYPITEIARDFGTISDVIGELAVEQDFPLDPRSYRLLNACLDKAVAECLEEYFEESRAQGEKGMAETIGKLGHELRNALGSAQMAFRILQTGEVGMESRTARVLERSLWRLDSLVRQTLAAVQLRVGNPIERVPQDVRQLLTDVVEASLVEREIEVETDVPAGLALDADPRLLESALSNLVQNAIKFTHAGGHVNVRARETLDGVVFEVEDECGGLNGKNPADLFRPFVQGETQRTRGVGLGLSITRQAVEAHGGYVTVRDEPPKGCVFVVWLPR